MKNFIRKYWWTMLIVLVAVVVVVILLTTKSTKKEGTVESVEPTVSVEPIVEPTSKPEVEPTKESEVTSEHEVEPTKEAEEVNISKFIEVNNWYQTIDGNGLFCTPGMEDENGLTFLGSGQQVYVYGYFPACDAAQIENPYPNTIKYPEMLFFTQWSNLEKCENNDASNVNQNDTSNDTDNTDNSGDKSDDSDNKTDDGDSGKKAEATPTPVEIPTGNTPTNVPTAPGAESWKDVPCSDPNAHIIQDSEYTAGQQWIRHYEADGYHWTDWTPETGGYKGIYGTEGKTLYYDMNKTQVDTSYTAPYRVMVIRQCLENGMLEINWAPEGTRWIDSAGTYSE